MKVFLDQTTGCESAPSLSIKDGIVKPYSRACILTEVVGGVSPGEAYGVVLSAKGECAVGAIFKDERGAVMHSADAVCFLGNKSLKDGWRQVSGVVVVPYGASSFHVSASVGVKYGENQFWVDDVHIYKLW